MYRSGGAQLYSSGGVPGAAPTQGAAQVGATQLYSSAQGGMPSGAQQGVLQQWGAQLHSPLHSTGGFPAGGGAPAGGAQLHSTAPAAQQLGAQLSSMPPAGGVQAGGGGMYAAGESQQIQRVLVRTPPLGLF